MRPKEVENRPAISQKSEGWKNIREVKNLFGDIKNKLARFFLTPIAQEEQTSPGTNTSTSHMMRVLITGF